MSCPSDCDITDVYYNNDHSLTLSDLTADGTYLNAATVTYQIYDLDNTAVTSATGTLTLNGTAGGDYQVTIDKTIINLLTVGQEYRIQVSGTEDTADFEFNLYIRVKRRGAS